MSILTPWQARKAMVADPFTDARRQMNDLMTAFFGDAPTARADGFATFSPKIDVRQSDNAIDVSAELPGLAKEDIEVTVEKDVMTIRGEKRFEHEEKKKDLRYVERSYGSFLRTVALPFEVDQEKVEATLKDGVMRIHLSRCAEDRKTSRKVAIK